MHCVTSLARVSNALDVSAKGFLVLMWFELLELSTLQSHRRTKPFQFLLEDGAEENRSNNLSTRGEASCCP
jgi:hypothetical protein